MSVDSSKWGESRGNENHPVRIAVEQERPESSMLLRAANQLHRKAKHNTTVRWTFALMLASLSIVAIGYPFTAGYVALAGLVGFLLIVLFFNPNLYSINRDAAMIQEMFDTRVFGLRRTIAEQSKEIPEKHILSLSRAYKDPYLEQGKPRAWYPPDSDKLPWPLNVFVCQRTNLYWDIRQRYRWSLLLTVGALMWLAIGLTVAVVQSWSLASLVVAWLVPSLAAVTLAFEEARKQHNIANQKAKLVNTVSARISQEISTANEWDLSRAQDAALFAREVQDEIFYLRSESGRIPEWLYRSMRANSIENMLENADMLSKEWSAAGGKTP